VFAHLAAFYPLSLGFVPLHPSLVVWFLRFYVLFSVLKREASVILKKPAPDRNLQIVAGRV
jgi:hypothetical protein